MYDFSYKCDLKNKTKNEQTETHIENKLMAARGMGIREGQNGWRRSRGKKFQLKKRRCNVPTSPGTLKKQESSRKNIYFHFIDYAKAFDCVDHNKL